MKIVQKLALLFLNIEQALHPKSSIKLMNTKFAINNEILYSSTRKFNLDKDTFSIVFEG